MSKARVTREQAIRILVYAEDGAFEHWPHYVTEALGVEYSDEEDYPLIYDVLEALGVPQSESRRIESAWPPEERDRKPGAPPYTVEVDDEGCQSCGHDRMWMVVGPDGDGVDGRSFGDKDDADDLADALNEAYATGHREAGREYMSGESYVRAIGRIEGMLGLDDGDLDETVEAVRQLVAKAEECDRLRTAIDEKVKLWGLRARIDEWTRTHGDHLRPGSLDTFGEGMRVAKAMVAGMLAELDGHA